MADLIIQSVEHFVDSPVLSFWETTDIWVTYTHHDQYADVVQLNSISLTINNAFHDHVSFDIKQIVFEHDLTVAAADHLLETTAVWIGFNYSLWMTEPAVLPNLKLLAQSGTRINCPPAGLMLPGLMLEMRAGARLSKWLPALDLTAEGHGATSMRLTGRLPDLRCDARTGIRARTTLRLPVLTIEATGLAGSGTGASLDKTLPGLTIEAHGERRGAGDLAKNLPALTINATGMRDEWAELAEMLPTLMISATGHRDQSGSLNENLPALQLSARGVASSMQLVADLPTLVMTAPPDGATGGGPGSLTDQGRFDDFVMRYAR
jgi:hypothetical protein